MIDGPTAVLLTAIVPLLIALRRNRRSTIIHALVWAVFAWLGWLSYAVAPGLLTAFAALSLTGAAGIAVFGARRPGAFAWHFIVVSLLVILWIGWAEGLLTGHELKLGPARLTFLTGLLLLTVLNYLPTRAGFGAALLALGCSHLLWQLWKGPKLWSDGSSVLVGLATWAAANFLCSTSDEGTPTDRRWRQFRDRFGVVWAQRLREQFNAAAKHNGWPFELRWHGLHPPTADVPADVDAALVALEKRFWSARQEPYHI